MSKSRQGETTIGGVFKWFKIYYTVLPVERNYKRQLALDRVMKTWFSVTSAGHIWFPVNFKKTFCRMTVLEITRISSNTSCRVTKPINCGHGLLWIRNPAQKGIRITRILPRIFSIDSISCRAGLFSELFYWGQSQPKPVQLMHQVIIENLVQSEFFG